MIFTKEKLTQSLVDELHPLMVEHYEEIAHYKDIQMGMDWDRYFKLYEAGALRVFIARECEGKAIGYAFYFVQNNLHYMTSRQANQDIIFITKQKRGFTGSRLIDFCDDQLRDEGCSVVYQHVKVNHNFGRMLERKGYELIDLIYGKRL